MNTVLGLEPLLGYIYIVNIVLIVAALVYSFARAIRRGEL